MYVQNTTVEALKLPWWRQITHNLEHYFLSGAPFMDPVFFSEDQQVRKTLMHRIFCSFNIRCIRVYFCRSADICGLKVIEIWVNFSSTLWLTFRGMGKYPKKYNFVRMYFDKIFCFSEILHLKIFWECIGTWQNKEKSWNIWPSTPQKIPRLCGITDNGNVHFGLNTYRLSLDTLHRRIRQPQNFGGNRIVLCKLLFGPCHRRVWFFV